MTKGNDTTAKPQFSILYTMEWLAIDFTRVILAESVREGVRRRSDWNSNVYYRGPSLLSMPVGVDYVVIGFDMEVQPSVTHNAA